MVIMLEALNERGEDSSHLHFIVVKIGDSIASFDIHGLLQTLVGTSMEMLQPEFESKYIPWIYTSPKSVFQKINTILPDIESIHNLHYVGDPNCS